MSCYDIENYRLSGRSYCGGGKRRDEEGQIELQSLLRITIFRTIVYFIILEKEGGKPRKL